jgi:hypothetical protein
MLRDLRSLAAYTALAIVMTWPLVRGLSTDIPGDLGDSLLNCWILGWNDHLLLRALHGDLGALRGLWHANIFFPEPYTLAYSEHLMAESLEALPVYAVTGNLILCYNLLFLSTFALSAWGAYLLVREITREEHAALLAGVLYGFGLYRLEQMAHLQVLSSQWMPFVLFGLLRHFRTRRLRPLVGALMALVVQGLSCGYYLLYFPPFVVAYVLHETARRGRWRDLRHWLRLGLGGIAVAVVTLPFLLPYAATRARLGWVRERAEVERFSADVYAYFSAPAEASFWGRHLNAYPGPEAHLFPGLTPMLLCGAAVVAWLAGSWRGARGGAGTRERAGGTAAAIAGAAALAAVAILLGVADVFDSVGLRVRSLPHALGVMAGAAALALLLSRRARNALGLALRSPAGFYVPALLLAVALSWGPTIRRFGEAVAEGPYLLLYRWLPGYDGLRVPARFAMLALLFASVLAGWGVAWLCRRRRAAGGALVCVASLAALAEASGVPLPINLNWYVAGLRSPPARVIGSPRPSGIYEAVAALPQDAVIAELPFGYEPYELRYMLASTSHWRRLVNGFSGLLPDSYVTNRADLRRVLTEPERAWQRLRLSGATHAVVHEDAWGLRPKGRRVSRWLEEHGARRLAETDDAALFALE